MARDLKSADALAGRLKDALAFRPSRYDDPAAYAQTITTLKAAVQEADPRGRLEENAQGAVLRAFGFRATSTSGLYGACSNWIQQVRSAAEKEGDSNV